MVMSLDEPIRQLIDGFATGQITMPVRIGAGSVYFVPSASELGEFYVVSEVGYMEKGKNRNAWICSCKAFRFGQQGDWCKHIRTVQEGIDSQIKVMRKKGKK
jgi:hypothetical protein